MVAAALPVSEGDAVCQGKSDNGKGVSTGAGCASQGTATFVVPHGVIAWYLGIYMNGVWLLHCVLSCTSFVLGSVTWIRFIVV